MYKHVRSLDYIRIINRCIHQAHSYFPSITKLSEFRYLEFSKIGTQRIFFQILCFKLPKDECPIMVILTSIFKVKTSMLYSKGMLFLKMLMYLFKIRTSSFSVIKIFILSIINLENIKQIKYCI